MNNFIELKGSNTIINIEYIASIFEEVIIERPDFRSSGNKPYDYFNETMNIGPTYRINPETFEKEEVTNQRKQIQITMVNGVKYISYESKDDFMSRVSSILNSHCISCN